MQHLRLKPPQPATVYSVVQPYWRICALAGMGYHKAPEVGQPQSMSTLLLLNFLRLVIMELTFLLVFIRIAMNTVTSRQSFVLDYGLQFCQISSASTTLLATILFSLGNRSFVEILRTIHVVDELFQSLKISSTLSEQQNTLMKSILIVLMIHLGIHVASTFIFLSKDTDRMMIMVRMILTMFAVHIPYTIAVGNYLLYFYLIRRRFQHLNNLFVVRFDTSSRRQLIWIRELMPVAKNRMEIIVTLSEIHAKLTEAVGLLGGSQWVSFIFISVNVVSFTTFNIYLVVRTVVGGQSGAWWDSLPSYLWNLFFVVMYVAVIVQSTSTGWEAAGTVDLVHKAINNEKDTQIWLALRDAARQFGSRSAGLDFKVHGGGFPELFSTMGLIGTYLVILIQFDSMMN